MINVLAKLGGTRSNDPYRLSMDFQTASNKEGEDDDVEEYYCLGTGQ
jgi:hypothetical protein